MVIPPATDSARSVTISGEGVNGCCGNAYTGGAYNNTSKRTLSMPVKIFSGVDYIVEKSVNRFIKGMKILDIQITSHIHNDKVQITVLIHYEGETPAHASGPRLL